MQDNYLFDFAMLVALAIGLRLLGFFALLAKTFRKHKWRKYVFSAVFVQCGSLWNKSSYVFPAPCKEKPTSDTYNWIWRGVHTKFATWWLRKSLCWGPEKALEAFKPCTCAVLDAAFDPMVHILVTPSVVAAAGVSSLMWEPLSVRARGRGQVSVDRQRSSVGSDAWFVSWTNLFMYRVCSNWMNSSLSK